MSTHDLSGREWARVDETFAGNRVSCDGDFTCMAEGAVKTVKIDDGGFYVRCACDPGETRFSAAWARLKDVLGRGQNHYLDGQLNDEGTHYVGLYPADPAY